MKTFTRLVEEICFEAGTTGLNDLEVTAGLIIEEVLDKHTSQIRYEELYVPNTTLVVTTLATGLIALPTDYQHVDWESFVIQPGGEIGDQYQLRSFSNRVRGVNEGYARWYTRNGTSISVYPYVQLSVTDVFKIAYWRKSNAKTNNLIVPDCLVQTVKDESISRLALTLGSKTAAPYMVMSRESHGASLGATDLPSQN